MSFICTRVPYLLKILVLIGRIFVVLQYLASCYMVHVFRAYLVHVSLSECQRKRKESKKKVQVVKIPYAARECNLKLQNVSRSQSQSFQYGSNHEHTSSAFMRWCFYRSFSVAHAPLP